MDTRPRAFPPRVAPAWVATACLVVLAWPAAAQESGLEWPVEVDAPGGLIILYQPQVESFEGDVLESLNEAGYLQPVFMAVASLSRMRDLIERRNRLRP